jgi:hypothetical protein
MHRVGEKFAPLNVRRVREISSHVLGRSVYSFSYKCNDNNNNKYVHFSRNFIMCRPQLCIFHKIIISDTKIGKITC